MVRIGLVARACGSGNGQSPSSSVTVVDRTTRLAEAIPVQSTTAQVVADSFVANWVARFGVPATRQQARADNCLPPTGQRHGGAVPPPAEGGTTCQVQQWGLVGRAVS